jgi:transcriptional regulator with XRE-family HTH domain
MPVTEAARRAGISDTRWSQLENGYRMVRGQPEPEPPPPAATLARMAQAVGVTAAELEQAGRADAAAEMRALPRQLRDDEPRALSQDQLDQIVERVSDHIDGRIREILSERGGADLPNGTTGAH